MADGTAPIGHNNPPEPSPYEAVRIHLEDMLTEARNWADGFTVETQEQADDIDRLADDLRKGAKAAEAARVEEKKPLDEQINAIQARYNVYIAPLTVKAPGKVSLAVDALLKTVLPWRLKLKAEADAKAAAAAAEAQRKADEAAAAVRAAEATNLEAREAAEARVKEAAQAQTQANRATKAATTGTGLRDHWEAVMTDGTAALKHYWATNRPALEAAAQALADTDVRNGKRSLPGFDVVNNPRPA